MGIFRNPGGVTREKFSYVPCGQKCGKCGRGSCTMQSGHNASWHGHESKGKDGCGCSWGGEHG